MEQESVETREFSRANILFSNVETWKLYAAQSQESKPVRIIWLIWNWSCALILLGFLGVYISAIEWYEVKINALGLLGCLQFCCLLLATKLTTSPTSISDKRSYKSYAFYIRLELKWKLQSAFPPRLWICQILNFVEMKLNF